MMINMNNLHSPSNILSSALANTAAVEFTNIKWPNNPFHKGEIALQQLEGSQDAVMSYAPQVVRPFMPIQHREFFSDLPFLVAAARDDTGALWATLLEHPEKQTVASSPDPTTLVIHALPAPGDALEHVFAPNDLDDRIDIGLLGIQFETARRNRMNGRAKLTPDGSINVHVDQSFGNCPQYIKPRPTWTHVSVASTPVAAAPIRATELSPAHVAWIEQAETFFTATGYREPGGEEDVRFGNDASHRGGPPGFVRVENGGAVVWTEFNGNHHFNSLGNLLLDPRIGLCFPNFATGGLLQLTGTAEVDFGPLDQGGRQVRMTVTAINELPAGSLPVRWKAQDGPSVTRMRVAKVETESSNVKSFYIQPIEASTSLTKFRAGQHLPIQLTLPNGEVIQRSYSLSSAPSSANFYRISVKHHVQGKASSFLHSHIHAGDYISVGKPGGDFVLQDHSNSDSNDDAVVLVSAGIGLTPFVSMLHEIVKQNESRPVYWFHGVRNGREHALQKEMEYLRAKLPSLKLYTVYSRPDATDHSYDAEGRITAAFIQERMPNVPSASFYLCGPPSFLADVQSGLEGLGVRETKIFFESF